MTKKPPPLRRKRTSPVQKALAPDPLRVAKNYRADKAQDLRSNLMDPEVVEALKRAICTIIVEGPMEESSAAKMAGVPLPIFEQWKREDDAFVGALASAFREATDSLASTGMQRAARKSDRLMEFFLQQRDPERFGKDPGARRGQGGLLTMTLDQIEAFIQLKRREEQLLLKTIEGTAVDTTATSES